MSNPYATAGRGGVEADRTHLKQVLINLLSNAIKYNQAGGSVLVSCVDSSPGRIRIGVEDTGEGLAADKLLHLFQPFNRLGKETSAEEGTASAWFWLTIRQPHTFR